MAAPFYVYVFFRLNGVPCYVGKGQRDRWRTHVRKSHNRHLQHIFAKSGGELPGVKVREGLTNDEACKTEIALIAAIGRADLGNGPLVNLTDGGEGMTGHIPTKASREKKSEALKGKSRPPHIIAAMLAGCGTPQWRENQSKAHLGKTASPSSRKKQSEARLGKIGLTVSSLEERLELFRSIPRERRSQARAAADLGVSELTAKRWCAKAGIELWSLEEQSAAQSQRNAGNQYGLGNKRTPEGQAAVTASVTAANSLRVATPEYRQLRRQIALRMHANRRASVSSAQSELPL